MMLRRLKEDVEKSLAPKEETIIEVFTINYMYMYMQIGIQCTCKVCVHCTGPTQFTTRHCLVHAKLVLYHFVIEESTAVHYLSKCMHFLYTCI